MIMSLLRAADRIYAVRISEYVIPPATNAINRSFGGPAGAAPVEAATPARGALCHCARVLRRLAGCAGVGAGEGAADRHGTPTETTEVDAFCSGASLT